MSRVIRHADQAPQRPSTLPGKEAALFRQIIKFYELKQYKKGMKAAEAVLKKVPEHGETLAMKALLISQMPGYNTDRARKDEAMDLVKRGLKNDLKSTVCWHVLGLIHRQEKQYDEASRAYLNALKFEKDNQQIIRDLTNLQIQRRDYEGFNETQHRLLELKPAIRTHWLGLAVSYHLLGVHAQAVRILDAWHKTNTDVRTGAATHDQRLEDQELWLYRCWVLEEGGDKEGALKDLEGFEGEGKVLDPVAWNEAKGGIVASVVRFCVSTNGSVGNPTGRLYFALGKPDKAAECYHALLAINPDDASLFSRLESCLDDTSPAALLAFYRDMESRYPRSTHVRHRILELLPASDEDWQARITAELRKGFRKGVPSLFTSLERLWLSGAADAAEKKDWIRAAVQAHVESLEKSGTFPSSDEREPPTAIPWSRLFLALLHDSDGNPAGALAAVDAAIAHTPTLVELHMFRGRALKRAGRLGEAADALQEARELDLQDRFVNTKCAKYLLRAGRYEEAERVVVLFTKAESTDPVAELVEQQVMWWAAEAAEMWARKGEWGRAMKRWYQIEKVGSPGWSAHPADRASSNMIPQHFADFYEDQFDYHQYCLRRMTMRSYIQMLRFEDRLRSHPFFFRAACGAVRAFLHLHDNPSAAATAAEKLEKEMEGLSVQERKKAAKKAGKEAEKEKAAAAAAAAGKKDGKEPPKPKDEDPDGEKLLEAAKADYLAEATRLFLKPLLEQSPGRVESQVLGAQVYLRRRKPLLALRSLLAGLRIEPENAELHLVAAQLHKELATSPPENAAVREIVEEGIKRIFPEFPGTDLAKWNDEWRARNPGLVAAVSAARVSALLDPSSSSSAADSVVAAFESASHPPSLKEAIEAHGVLLGMDAGAAERAFRTGAGRWPLADYFRKEEKKE
ncbi:NMDA receptor-regulated protein 1-domain-containing protein [Hyaloraphidium curvatum]|nr:NMDA receptor-regulated protein 1-domain-containing protein [Hyaloraphidium curvatum]